MCSPSPASRTAVRGNEDAHGTRVDFRSVQPPRVMPGLVPGIHAEPTTPISKVSCGGAAWMAGTSPAMTRPAMTRGGCKDFLPCNRFGFPGHPCARREKVALRSNAG